MRTLTTKDFPYVLPKLLKYEAESFGDYPYTPAPERLTAWWEANAFWLAGVEDENGKLGGLFTAFATTAEDAEAFRTGRLSSSKAMVPHPYDGSAVSLYIPTLIIGDRYWMPVLFKSLLREMNATLENKKAHVEKIFGTAADKRAIFLMDRFGFEVAGQYKDEYKVMVATRESCAMLRNLVR